MILANVLGYSFALVVGHVAVFYVSKELWANLGRSSTTVEQLRPSTLHPAILGFIERALYIASRQISAVEFVGVWLAIKVAGQWSRWGEGYKIGDETIVTGREFFNVFLIGNALSISYALVGALMIDWLQNQQIWVATLVALVLVIATVGIFLTVKWSRNSGAA